MQKRKTSIDYRMICRNCLRAASHARAIAPSIPHARRFLASSSSSTASSSTSTSTSTSTASAQSTPPQREKDATFPPSSATTTNPPPSSNPSSQPAVQEKKTSPLVKSSIPAGQPLKGLNFLKNAQDPVALPDEEYPAWLWTLLQRQSASAEGVGGGDLFCTCL